MNYKEAYTLSYDKETDQWYCHMIGFPSVPVMGSFGSKRKAQEERQEVESHLRA